MSCSLFCCVIDFKKCKFKQKNRLKKIESTVIYALQLTSYSNLINIYLKK